MKTYSYEEAVQEIEKNPKLVFIRDLDRKDGISPTLLLMNSSNKLIAPILNMVDYDDSYYRSLKVYINFLDRKSEWILYHEEKEEETDEEESVCLSIKRPVIPI